MKIKANGISMNYQIKGKGANLVLIHGAGDNLNMWYHQVPVFSKSYCVITYDIRGSGKTESPKGEYSVPLFSEDAYELIRAIKVKQAYFLGYSMGGRIALELAINHPELVEALILANSSVGLAPLPPETLERMRATLELLDKGDMRKVAERMTVGAFSSNFKSKNPTEFKRYMRVKLRNKIDGIAPLMRSLGAPTVAPDLSKVKCPVLIIVGEHDLYMGVEQGKREHEAIASSKLVILPTGHAAAVELPEKFNSTVLEFLLEVRSG
jgi:pimeloyl-ACP methyl ester carboxylesterase